MTDKHLLLFIEPENYCSDKPVIDSLTRKMTASFRKGLTDVYVPTKNGTQHKNVWIMKRAWMGVHNCICGATSMARNFMVAPNEETNSLCIHYLAYHRDEIPQKQLNRVAKLVDGEEEPTEDELKYYRSPDYVHQAQTRAEYLAGLETELTMLIDPGDATPEDIGEIFTKLSDIYESMGGSGLVYKIKNGENEK